MAETKAETEQYRITREKRSNSPYPYEFVMYDLERDEEVITATQLEGLVDVEFEAMDNWTDSLKVFAKRYFKTRSIEESVEAVNEEYGY